jgi:multicomponent Na+:H+ antiporter subunit D
MSVPLVTPASILIVGAVLVAFLPRAARSALTVLMPLVALGYAATFLPAGTVVSHPFLGTQLELVRSDTLSLLFAGIFCVTGAIAALYAAHEGDVKQQVTAQLYVAGAVGAAFAGDWLTLYAFCELLAITGTVLVWSGGTRAAERAGKRYVLLHLAGGAVLLAGIVLTVTTSGSLRVVAFDPATPTLATWLVLIGFCLNAGVPPLHAWIPDAYPKATVAGSVFLSAMTTKTAVYALLRAFPGFEILIPLGLAMALYGVLFAVLATDLRTLLAYHIVSQVGYMVAGAGIGSALAIDGAAAHAVNNLLYKGLLFMCAGAVITTTGRGNLADLGGLRARQPLLLALYAIGALSICGLPGWNGFYSKGMLIVAASDAHHPWAVLLMLLASVGTFVSVGLKLPWFVWFGDARPLDVRPLPRTMIGAMAITAALCTAIGVVPDLLGRFLPSGTTYDPFTATHVIEVLQLSLFAGFAFFLLLPSVSTARKTLADLDVLYRVPAPLVRRILVGRIDALFDAAQAIADRAARGAASALRDPTTWLGERRMAGRDFDPDASRPPLLTPLAVTIATFVVIAVVLLSWQG